MRLRKNLLSEQCWELVVNLGAKSFQTPMWDFNIGFSVISNTIPFNEREFYGLDVSNGRSANEKEALLQEATLSAMLQADQLRNPDARIVLERIIGSALLEQFATSTKGLTTGDEPRLIRRFWEFDRLLPGWEYFQSTVSKSMPYGGRESLFYWCSGKGPMQELPGARTYAQGAWGKRGILVSQMGSLPVTLYMGDAHDNNTAVIVPRMSDHLSAIWYFCCSKEFNEAVRKIDSKIWVTNASLVKIPFDLARWQKVAEEAGPLPEPYSNDPTQWLFNGRPAGSAAPLQVAVARLLGYRWPQQEYDGLDLLADEDGIACLPAVARELPAEDRLRGLLARAYGAEWGQAVQSRLLADVGARELGVWLRDDFFKQHCAMFHNRPFIWQIWDGRKDGFAALVNYHKLDAARLDKLIYTYLGNWIETQRAAVTRGEAGADGLLVAALELQAKLIAIKTGEPPYDIYVRWKPLHEQPIGWNPDLNDGVRLNIRPFVTAGILRARFTVNWNKDRGTNPDGSERLNDLHYRNEQKQAARGG